MLICAPCPRGVAAYFISARIVGVGIVLSLFTALEQGVDVNPVFELLHLR